jgi:hypothetical protein
MAEQIKRDLPHLTVHDGSHLDALWVLADSIAGPEVHLNPAEGFLFGAAVLLHDLGLAVAAYPGGLEELRAHEVWRDAVGLELRARLDRAPTESEIANADEEVKTLADRFILRERHAEQAVDLATIRWGDPDDPIYLLEDRELRKAFGHRAGQIAASHWWPVSDLRRFAHDLLAVAELPAVWTVDVLKVACLLRLADIAHLDSRRAPSLRRALQLPTGHSALHWDFQELLARPVVLGDRFVFNSHAPFNRDRADAWWLCADALAAVDREFSQVAGLLDDLNRTSMALRGVIGAEDPYRLQQTVLTEGWEPVDARVHISDVPSLVNRLGGRQLYGNDPTVPIREAVQNAADAVCARGHVEPHPFAGVITVEFEVTDDRQWLAVEITDNGIGMARELLAGQLLDFGRSLWREPDVMRRVPGLAASGFEATGRFGIGFFALFMYERPVMVLSRFHLAGAEETHVLDCARGLKHRATIRRADATERLYEPGTRVTFQVPSQALGDQLPDDLTDAGLSLLGRLCPTLEVDLVLRTADGDVQVLSGGDWRTVPALQLVTRIGARASDADLERMREVRDPQGEIVGRLVAGASNLYVRELPPCVITVGGLSAARSATVMGVLLGDKPNVARSSAHLLATRADLADWASEQAQLWAQADLRVDRAIDLAAMVARYGGDIGDLPVCYGEDGPLNRAQLVTWAAERDEIIVWDQIDHDDLPKPTSWSSDFRPGPDTLVIDAGLVTADPYRTAPPDPNRVAFNTTLLPLVVRGIAEAWGQNLDDVENSAGSTDDMIGAAEDDEVYSSTATLYKRHAG